VSPDDPELKAMSAGLFSKELTEYATSSERLASASAQLSESYHAQVQTKPTNLFLHSENGRVALDVTENGFMTRDGRAFERDVLLKMIQEQPELFSPNVVLRPLMQDTVLPTAAYVAGPGEVAYFAQFKGLYEWADLAMPIIYPRASVTIMEKRIEKIVARFNLSIPSFEEQFERLFGQVVLDQMEVDVEALFKKASSHLHQAINEIKPVVEQVDRSLVKTADATRNEMMKEWMRLKDRVLKAERQQQDVVRSQLYRASSNLFPFEIPQERALSPLYFLNKYGPDFGQKLINTLDLDTTSHQVIEP
jgi:bacillithiol biosynthesis cysteine-adding enzyme BshC